MVTISFPLGIAEGDYFCNRVRETKQLVKNICNCRHTVLISPRRYGKTSLAYRAINESKLANARVDLFMTTSASDIEKAILAGVNSLLTQISNNAEALLGLIKDFLQSLKPSFEASSSGLKIKLEVSGKGEFSSNICEALQVLDGVLRKKKMRAVLLIDEFQEVQRVAADKGLEGAIRHVAQETKNLSLIFSGSHRHLLSSMFNDRSKPLYRLCDEIQLQRIERQEYFMFMQKFAQKKWGESVAEAVINKIIEHSECHSYYLNVLCEQVFNLRRIPKEEDIDKAWANIILAKKADLLAETKGLSIACKKLLVAIAHGLNYELSGKKFLAKAELAGTTVVRGLEYLEENDFIEKRAQHYYLLDPLLKGIINQISYL